MRLSNVIHVAAWKYKIPARTYTAMLMQESNYRLSAKNIQCGLPYKKVAKAVFSMRGPISERTISRHFAAIDKKPTCIIADAGISQVNYITSRRYKMDYLKIMTDLKYSVNSGAKILGDFRKNYGKDPDWWVRYNCGTRGTTKRLTCKTYKKLVSRFL